MIFLESAWWLALFASPFFAGFLFSMVILGERHGYFIPTVATFGFFFAICTRYNIDPSANQVLIAAALYIPIGLVWSVYRYRVVVAETIELINDKKISAWQGKELSPSQMSGHLTVWTITWPFGLVFHFVGDTITGIKNFIKTYLRNVLDNIWKPLEELTKEKS